MTDPIKSRKAKRKAKEKSIEERVVSFHKQGQAGFKKIADAEVASEKAYDAKAKENVDGRTGGKSTYGEMRQQKAVNDRSYAGKGAIGDAAKNAEKRLEATNADGQLQSGSKKQIKSTVRKAVRNKDRSKQARQSDKNRIKRM
jgi:hypothetical protein